jgi:signal transduction histidine kinase
MASRDAQPAENGESVTMELLNAAIGYFEDLQRKLGLSPRLRRMGGVLLLLLVGCLDYVTPPELASAPFYFLPLIPIAFLEPVPICVAFSLLAAVIYFGADVLSNPGTFNLIYPYWRAFARLISFGLISLTISLLVGERRRLLLSEHALQDKAQELEAKNRALGENLRELKRLQDELVEKERRTAALQIINSATHELERPLVSISVYAEEILRLMQRNPEGEDPRLLLDEIQPLVEKMQERTLDMQAILKQAREFRQQGAG